MRHVLLGISAVVLSLPCSAQTISSLLDLARSGEPTYRGALTAVAAAHARTDQAFGALLPQASATANTNYNRRHYQERTDKRPPTEDDYNSNGYQLSITQPLWRYASHVGLQQAEAQLTQAIHQMSNTEEELLARLVSAWLDTLSAHDNVQFTAAQEAAARKQWEIAKRGLQIGTSGLPQAEEMRAKYDQARADAMAATNEFEVKLASLEQLVGPLPAFRPMTMIDDAVLADLSDDKLERWLEAIEVSSPAVIAARHGLEAADAEVRKQGAGHQPTLDLVATSGKNNQAVGGFPGQVGYGIRTTTVGLQLNVPLFSGGTQSAKVNEAVAMKEKARLDIEVARRAAALSVKQAWFGWWVANAKAAAGRQGVQAADAAMRAARIGQQSGLKMELDVLQAEQQLRAAQRDWRKGRYDQLAAHLKLKAAVGIATLEDVMALDKLFVPESTSGDESRRASLPFRSIAQGGDE
jgi:outer membrane protein